MRPTVCPPLIAHAVVAGGRRVATRTRAADAIVLAALLFAGLSAGAQTTAIADPTQPAGGAAVSPGAAGARASRAAGEPAAPTVWPKLQSVQVGDNGSGSAMIDGRIVQVGETVGALMLVAIDAQGVLLRGVRFEQRLALLPPGIEKTALTEPAALPPAAAAPPARPQHGRTRAAAVASIAPPPVASTAPTVSSHSAGLPLRLDLQLDSPEPIAPAALAQAPTKEIR